MPFYLSPCKHFLKKRLELQSLSPGTCVSRELFQQCRTQRLGNDVAATIFIPATARMLKKTGKSKSVVKRQLLANINIAHCNNLHAAFPRIPNGFAIFIAGVIDVACGIVFLNRRSVDKAVGFDLEKINRQRIPAFCLAGTDGSAAFKLAARNNFPAILRYDRSRRNRRNGKNPASVNRRTANFDLSAQSVLNDSERL